MAFLRSRPELLKAFREGDRDALSEVYRAYVGSVETFCRRGLRVVRGDAVVRVAAGTSSALGDLVQDVFVRAFAERGRLAYDGLRDYGPYLLTIARNLMVDRARRSGRELSIEDFPFEEPQTEATADDGAEPWAHPGTMAVVEAYLSGLEEPLRELHRQRYVLGLSQRDAAEALGISRQQLRTREAQLRAGLEEALRTAGLLA